MLINKIKKAPVFVMLAVFVLLVTIADIVVPDRDSSEIENKVLSHIPAVSVSSILNGSWTSDFGSYVQDQFVLRDAWITAYSALETEVLGKVETGGILLDKKTGMQYPRLFALTDEEAKLWEKNTDAFAEFCGRHEKTAVMIVPTASQMNESVLPYGAPAADENAMMDVLFNKLPEDARVIDLRNVLNEAMSESKSESKSSDDPEGLFYRNDHHWTTDGAFLAYNVYCGDKAVHPDESLRRKQPGFLGTSYSKSRWVRARADTLVWYDLPNEMTIYQVEGENNFMEKSRGSMYDMDALSGYDKYAFFLKGNNGYSRISGDGDGKILVIKDSYANCFVPFLTASYGTIDVLDLRNYQYSPDSLIDSEQYDEILILYGEQTLRTDTAIINLNRPGTV